MLLKCCTQYVSKFQKLSSGHRSRKGQFLFQSQRRTMPKNAQVKVLVTHLCPALGTPCTVAHQAPLSTGFSKLPHNCIHFTCQQNSAQNSPSQASTVQLPGVQVGFRKGRETRDQITNIHSIIDKAREFQKVVQSTSLTTLSL